MCMFAWPGMSVITSSQPRESSDTVTLVFIGDVMMHSRQLEYDYTTFLEPIRPMLDKADIAVANMEFTLAGEPYSGYPAFSAPDGYAEYVADCGVDVFLVANNHILDKGQSGLERTLSIYSRMGKMPEILDTKGIRIGIVNFTYGTNCARTPSCPIRYMQRDSVAADISRLRAAGADALIAFPHWGTEYETRHSAEQEEWAQWMADKGVDCILGAHPHVVQDTSHVVSAAGKKVPVVYSVGNAVSNMSAKNTRLELLVTLRIARDEQGSVSVCEPELTWLWCALPGTLSDTYQTIPIKDYYGEKELWITPSDYDNMIQTLNRYEKDN